MLLQTKSSKTQRLFTVGLLGILTVAFIFASRFRTVMATCVIFLSTISVYELYTAAGFSIKEKTNWWMYILSAPILLAAAIFHIPFYFQILCVLYPLVFIFFLFTMIKPQSVNYTNRCLIMLLALVVIYLFQSMQEIRRLDYGFYYLILPIVICALTDSFAYVWGSALGKRKLCPKISPRKTVEGALGGFLTCIITVLLVAFLVKILLKLNICLWLLAIITAISSIVSMFGDLAMSMVKRICGIKDFGNLLPGHGGILDRFDSHLMTIPFVYILVILFPIIR